MRLVPLTLASTFALVLGATACGGGDDRLSREEYISKADAICTRTEARLERLGDADSVERFAQLAEEAIPIVRKSYRDIEALAPPEDLEARVREWLKVNREGLRVLAGLPAAARARDSTEAESILRRADTNEQRAKELAREIGFKKCSE